MKSFSFTNLENLKLNAGGLSSEDILKQRSLFGSNDIVPKTKNPWLDILADTIKDPMIWFLLLIGSVFLFLEQFTDGLSLILAVLPLLLIDFVLHYRTQASTASLQKQISSKVDVIRNHQKNQVDAKDLVPGDLVLVRAGLKLPADGFFEKAIDIQIDESALSGESFPVLKKQSQVDLENLVKSKTNEIPLELLGYAGTKVLTGNGFLRVLATGGQTLYGEIVRSVTTMPKDRTPLQLSIASLVKLLVFVSLSFCVLLAFIRIFQGYGWLDALLSAATLAVAAIPEEFPVVFTFYLGVGIYRLAKKKALVRKAVSVENIGRVTHICSDKTGTITTGKLFLAHVEPHNDNNSQDLLWGALAASSSSEDPLDLAIQEAANREGFTAPKGVFVYPFTEDRKRETKLVRMAGEGHKFYTKGAPETILKISNLAANEKEHLLHKISDYARSGHKVIAVAAMIAEAKELEQEPESNMTFLGLLAFEDPPRKEVKAAMDYCRKNNIHTMMITGDHPETAAAIAQDAGLVLTTPIVGNAENEPEKFQESWLKANPDFLNRMDVVSRCTPLQKLNIVKALKNVGAIVAVTGDGVNDVPALKAADIGIAMGERGTESAKEVASIILMDDNFSTLVKAIQEGRELFFNLKISFTYLLMIHIPLVLAAAFIPIIGKPLVFLPIHIVWLELIIHPTALLAFQSSNTLNPLPYQTQARSFFSNAELFLILLSGVLVTSLIIVMSLTEANNLEELIYARTKAVAILSLWSCGLTLFLTKLKSKIAILTSFTIFSLSVFFIQFSNHLKFLYLNPLSLEDWMFLFSAVSGVLFILYSVSKTKRFSK